ncbi:hypothetical protein WDZ92_35625, partial [Nostoc sp. NIES-2111]
YYEERLDWRLTNLCPDDLEIVRTRALPTRPIRVVGDIGIRGFPFHRAALRRLVMAKEIDFVLLTVPSFYSALLGQSIYLEIPFPFGIDYIDPWVHDWPEASIRYSKAWASRRLSDHLEPAAVRNASLITGVAPGYYQGVLERNNQLARSSIQASMPYGCAWQDFEAIESLGAKPSLFGSDGTIINIVYAGALLPQAQSVLRNFLAGLVLIKERKQQLYEKLRIFFIGTGKSATDQNGHNVAPLAQSMGLGAAVYEKPERMAYIDVLAHLKASSAVLVLGSTEPHYTPSKVFQAIQSMKPVLAFLHKDSTATQVMLNAAAGKVIPLSEETIPSPEEIFVELTEFLSKLNKVSTETERRRALEPYTAEATASVLACAMDEAINVFDARRARGL